ncbi:MAG: hypothetical protein ACR2N3_15370 [Pyrinomonadaceae bacterium]
MGSKDLLIRKKKLKQGRQDKQDEKNKDSAVSSNIEVNGCLEFENHLKLGRSQIQFNGKPQRRNRFLNPYAIASLR